jgi:hypothetical protein
VLIVLHKQYWKGEVSRRVERLLSMGARGARVVVVVWYDWAVPGRAAVR